MMPIVEAIIRYRDTKQELPASLDDLVPAFLQRLPDVPTGGKSWDYAAWGVLRKNFSVTLRLDRETIDYRSTAPGHWFYRDSSF